MTLRESLEVAAVGAIAQVRPDLHVQKVGAAEVVVLRKGRTRRCPL